MRVIDRSRKRASQEVLFEKSEAQKSKFELRASNFFRTELYFHQLSLAASHPLFMDSSEIQRQCNEFLKTIGVPGFIVIGLSNGPEKVDVVYAIHEMPVKSVIKGLTGTLNDFIQRM